MKVNITQKKSKIVKELGIKRRSYNISIKIEDATTTNIASLKRAFEFYVNFVNKNKNKFGFPEVELLLPEALKESSDKKLSVIN